MTNVAIMVTFGSGINYGRLMFRKKSFSICSGQSTANSGNSSAISYYLLVQRRNIQSWDSSEEKFCLKNS